MTSLEALPLLPENATPPNFELQPGAFVERRYQIRRFLATGGMATLYEAFDTRLDRPVALKVLRPQPGKTPELTELFLNEARAMAKLRSANVTRVLDCGGIRHVSGLDLPFMVLELLSGVDLWTLLQQNVRLSAPLTARYMLDVCEGLAEAHSLGIVHCDIKPENLFLAREADGTQMIKLLDFGISEPPEQSGSKRLKSASDLVGSPLYMSPEQMQSMPVDARSDIWGLGAVMCECVTGEPVFSGSTIAQIRGHVLDGPLPDVRQMNPGVDEAFVLIVERCLERDPSLRFQNVADLAQALEPLANPRRTSSVGRIARLLGMRRSEPNSFSPAPGANPEHESGRRRTFSRIFGRRLRRFVGLCALASSAAVLGYSSHRYSVTPASVLEATRHHASMLFGSVFRHQ